MTKRILTVAICVMATLSTATAQSGAIVDAEYNVPRETVNQVSPGKFAILVNRFTMGDGSQIEISEETPLFVIRAKDAVIGNSTTIIGRGRSGENGDPGTGTSGQAGADGPTIILIAEQQDIQGLSLISLGGDGGDGGKGETGSRGREAECDGPGAGNGGNGGKGGDGGNSGNGGNIFLILPRDTGGYGISLNVNWGDPGLLGPGGDGGPGGRGKSRCGPWPYYKRGAGRPGSPGPDGKPGNRGHRGLFRTYHIEDFDPDTIGSQLKKIVSMLTERGNTGDAGALQQILDSGLITGR